MAGYPVFQEPLAIAREADVEVTCDVLFGNPAEMVLHRARKQKAERAVVELGGDEVAVSLDGTDPETYADVRRGARLETVGGLPSVQTACGRRTSCGVHRCGGRPPIQV